MLAESLLHQQGSARPEIARKKGPPTFSAQSSQSIANSASSVHHISGLLSNLRWLSGSSRPLDTNNGDLSAKTHHELVKTTQGMPLRTLRALPLLESRNNELAGALRKSRQDIRMKVLQILFLSTALMVLDWRASAQLPSASPQESKTVTATREMLGAFAKVFTTPTKLTGKIARWVTAICPVAKGQKPAFTRFITQRVQAIAAAAGAPVNADPSCTPNIEIIFTTTPQDLLDHIRKDEPDFLGYATSNEQREMLAKVTRPVQAWYTTETIDLRGTHRIDSGRRFNTSMTMPNFSALGGANRDPIDLPDATYAHITGDHISDGARSGLNHVIIAIDSTRLAGQQLIPLSDYIAMLALTQLNSLDTCQQLPTIVNLMVTGCDQKIDGMTATDLAYLQGLYKMDADKSLSYQQSQIGDLMQDALRH